MFACHNFSSQHQKKEERAQLLIHKLKVFPNYISCILASFPNPWNSMNKVELRVIPGIKREKEIIGRDWSKIQELSKLEEYSQVSKRGFEQVLCGTKLFITIYNCICQLQGQTNQTFAEGQV